MIALRHGIPLVTMPDGRTASFDKQWIIGALQTAAHKTGYKRWWPAEHIAKSITIYLSQEFDAHSIKFLQLEEALSNLLQSLGYNDIADCFSLPDPPIYLSLLDLVREADTGYELAFFKLLSERLKAITYSTTQRLEILDLEPSLRLLTYRRRLLRRDLLREEVVSYIREYTKSGQFKNKNRRKHPLEIEVS